MSWAMLDEPLLTLMALLAQKVSYLTPALSSLARTLAWLSVAVFRSAAATAVPRSFQSLIALALLRSARGPKRIQKSVSALASNRLVSSERTFASTEDESPGAAVAPEPVAATPETVSTSAAPALTSERARRRGFIRCDIRAFS